MTTPADLSHALAAVDRVLRENDARHGRSWKRRTARHHVRHAAAHLAAWLEGDREEDHLGHGATRLLMALASAEGGA